MARRIIAVLGIFAIVILALLLMWRVYLHHRAGGDEDDGPGVIASLSGGVGGPRGSAEALRAQRTVRMKNRTLLPLNSSGAFTVRA